MKKPEMWKHNLRNGFDFLPILTFSAYVLNTVFFQNIKHVLNTSLDGCVHSVHFWRNSFQKEEDHDSIWAYIAKDESQTTSSGGH